MEEQDVEVERDEIDEVLAVLRGLADRVSSPVVRLCLQEALADIVHLAGRDGTRQAAA